MPSSAIIKNNAKTSLKLIWPKAFAVGAIALSIYLLVVSILYFVTTLFSGINTASALIAGTVVSLVSVIFIFYPFLLGITRWFWFTTLDNNVSASEIFHYFSSTSAYIRAFSFGFKFLLRMFFAAIICYLPFAVVYISTQPKLYETIGSNMPYWIPSLLVFKNVLFIIGTLLLILFALRYFPGAILLINDDLISTREALHLSTVISKSELGHSFSFILSFFGWYLLSIFVIPLLFIIPYFLSSYCVYSRFLINQYNRNAEIRNSTYFPNYRTYM